MVQNMNLPHFHPSYIDPTEGVAVFGMRGSGKTTTARSILKHMQNQFKRGVAINTTESLNHTWSNHVPPDLVYSTPSPDIIDRVMKVQTKRCSNLPPEALQNENAFVILDDCLVDKNFMNSSSLRSLLVTGRHYRIFFILTAQYINAVPILLRQNFDWVMVMPSSNRKEMHKVYDNFAVSVNGMSFDVFCKIMEDAATKKHCLVFNQNQKFSASKCMMRYKPEIDCEFRLCGRRHWEASLNPTNHSGEFPTTDNLKRFKTSRMKDGDCTLVIGMRESGKSTTTANFLRSKPHLRNGLIVSTTETMNGFWSKYAPQVFIHNQPDPNLIRKLMRMQERLKGSSDPVVAKKKAFLVLDDCLVDRKFMYCGPLREVLLTGRHYGISLFLNSQYAMSVPKELRQNFDWIVVIPSAMPKEIEATYELFGKVAGSKEAFTAIYNHVKSQRGSLVFHQSARESPLYMLTMYKSEPDPHFKIGDEHFRTFTHVSNNRFQIDERFVESYSGHKFFYRPVAVPASASKKEMEELRKKSAGDIFMRPYSTAKKKSIDVYEREFLTPITESNQGAILSQMRKKGGK